MSASGSVTTIKGTLNVDEAVTLDTTLDVTGDTSVSTFDSTGATSLATGGGVVNIASSGQLTTIKGTLNVDEAVTLDTTLDVTGDTSVSTFDSSGATSLATGGGAVNIASSGQLTTIKGTLNVDEAVTLDSTLDVTGDTSVSTFDSSGATSLATGGGAVNIASSGQLTTIKGTLNIDEAVTLDSTLDVTGDTSVSTFDSTGATSLATGGGAVNIASSGQLTTIKGTLNVDEATFLDTTLDVTGDTSVSTFDSSGATSLVTGGGAVNIASSGQLTTIKGTLNVDEVVTLDTTLDVTGDTSVSTFDSTGATSSATGGGAVNIASSGQSTTVKGSLTVNQAVALDTTLDVTGDTSVSTFDSSGATSLATGGGVVNIASSGQLTTIKGTLNVDEAVTLDTTLDVTGDTSVSTFDSSGATSLATGGGAVNIASSGQLTTIKGTLNVDEAVTLDTTLDVTGDTSVSTFDSTGATSLATGGEAVNIASSGQSTTVKGTLIIDEATTITGAIDANSTADIADTLTLSKASGTGLSVAADATISGNLTVAGDTITANVSTVTIEDPIITLGNDATDDNLDRGIEFKYNDGSEKLGFFGYDDSTSKFTFLTDATNTSEVFSGTEGNLAFGNLELSGTLDVTDAATLSSTLAVTGATTLTGALNANGGIACDR